MKTYKVRITARMTKTITVRANCEDDVINNANAIYLPLCDGADEIYEQDITDINCVEEGINDE